jgi:hypothetical protein
MLSPLKSVMVEFMILLVKMNLDVTQILKLSPLVSPNDLALDYNIFITMLYYILLISFHM